jgi:hypothetical protein
MRNYQVIKVALVTLLFYCLIFLVILAGNQWNGRVFVLETPTDLPTGQTWGVGYDGRFSYAIATNPWGSTTNLDQPGFRYQRILYPLIVYLLSLGNPHLVPWMMLMINLLSTFFGSAIFGMLLFRRGQSPWYGLIFFFSLGYLLSMRLDCLESLAFCLAFAGWLAYDKHKRALAIILFALGGLTKEVALLFPLALIIWESINRAWKKAGLLLMCLLPYAVWYFILLLWFGMPGEQMAKSKLGWIPFYGLHYLNDPVSRLLIGLFVLLPGIFFGFLAICELVKGYRDESTKILILILLEVAIIAMMPIPTWMDPIAILRLGLGLLAAIILWASQLSRRALLFIAAYMAPSALVFFLIPNIL